jgi:hypothetical protein
MCTTQSLVPMATCSPVGPGDAPHAADVELAPFAGDQVEERGVCARDHDERVARGCLWRGRELETVSPTACADDDRGPKREDADLLLSG